MGWKSGWVEMGGRENKLFGYGWALMGRKYDRCGDIYVMI